jgi:short-subunit dehydrogenase
MKYFNGKRVFITGGSSGIGLETAKILCTSGAHVLIAGRDVEKLKKAQITFEKLRVTPEQKMSIVALDVADNQEVEKKIPAAIEEFGVPDILINSAGVGHSDYFENITYEKFDEVIKINLYGTRNMIAALLPHMKSKGGGHIVNISSMMGNIGFIGYSVYSPSKFALVGLSECLRSEFKQFNIQVSVFCPPEIDTPMTDLMLKTSPPETRALVKKTGVLSSQRTAKILLNGIKKKRFLIIAGFLAKNAYLNKRFFPNLSRCVMDMIVLKSRRAKY